MTYSYFPGCTLKTKAKDLDHYARISAEALGFTLEELPDWQCCGGVYPMAKNEIATKLSSIRALAKAKELGQPLVTLCSACHNVIKQVNHDMQTDANIVLKANNYLKLSEPYQGETEVLHYLEVLRDKVGFDELKKKVVNPLKGKKIAAYYGCLLLRPGKTMQMDNPENPKILGELKIPGFSEYLHPYGDGKLLGIGMDVSEDGFTTEGVKLSMFNVTDPSNVTEENKYTIEESYGTDVGYNYKGVFVDVKKNLFGFVTYHDGVTYQLFTYDEAEGFKEVMSRQLSGYEGSRGLYIGDVFYLVSGNMIESYSMNGFEKMDDIVL